MNTSLKTTIVLITGAIAAIVGVWIRFHAEALGTVTLPEGQLAVIHSEEYIAVALPLIWLGGALIFLAAAAWLFIHQRSPKPVEGKI